MRRRITNDLPPHVSIPHALNNGTPPVPAVQPISGETISNCDFVTPVASGTPTVTSPGPIHAFNVSALTLTNVTIAGQGSQYDDHRQTAT